MNILILGGTGAMGTALVELLSKRNVYDIITITSRKTHSSDKSNIQYVQGNARELEFLKTILRDRYDVIVDFMSYSTEQFKRRYELFLDHTSQYIFISSARVYAQSDDPITEATPRLLDVTDDREFLETDEYALAKARCENFLITSERNNFTIVRPSITYGENRLQLGVLEKENWLYRALHGRSIVFSEDIASKLTAMTINRDVAMGIAALIGQESAYGEIYNITSEKSYTWSNILNVYTDVLERVTGKCI